MLDEILLKLAKGETVTLIEVANLVSIIQKQQKEIAKLQSRIDQVVNECAVSWINKTLKGE
jgi:hypothetical protein